MSSPTAGTAVAERPPTCAGGRMLVSVPSRSVRRSGILPSGPVRRVGRRTREDARRRQVADAGNVFDVVILGGGSGGYACAFRAADLGLSVALIDKAEVGGTCLHRGCIPTKALLHAAEVADLAREGASFGIQSQLNGIDMAGVNSYKDGVVGQLYKGLQGIVKARKITFVAGEGVLSAPNQVTVNGEVFTGRTLVLATGSVPKSLPGLTIDGNRIISSDHALKLDYVPASVVVLGGGA